MKEREKRQLQAEQANRLKELIKELGITQGNFAAVLGTHQETISMICRGSRNLSEGMAAKIGLKYGINPNWLLYGEGQKYASNQTSELQKANQLKQIAALRQSVNQFCEDINKQLDELVNEIGQ